jgi:predicted NodU family carbamoyl transferase
MSTTTILGISAFYHDSAAALVRDRVVVAAAQEERFTRNKHDPGFPEQPGVFVDQSKNAKTPSIFCLVSHEVPTPHLAWLAPPAAALPLRCLAASYGAVSCSL